MGRSPLIPLTQQVELHWQAIAGYWQHCLPRLSPETIGCYTRQFLCESAFAVGCQQVDQRQGWGLWPAIETAVATSEIQALLAPILTGPWPGAIAPLGCTSLITAAPSLATLELPASLLNPWLKSLWAAPISPEQLGQIYEIALHQSLQADAMGQDRKRQGSYFTPIEIADRMVQATLVPALQSADTPPRVLDPACGGGMFLLRAYRQLLNWRDRVTSLKSLTAADLMERCLFGVDRDAEVLRVTHLALLLQWLSTVQSGVELQAPPKIGGNLGWGNALVVEEWGKQGECGKQGEWRKQGEQTAGKAAELAGLDWGRAFPAAIAAGGFDVVISNPPYVDAEGMSKTDPMLRAYCTQHYQSARGNWDLFCPFVERGVQLCRAEGWLAMVVPNKLASAMYAAPVRQLLTQRATLHALWDYAQVAAFNAAVYPLVFVAQVQGIKSGAGETLSPAAVAQRLVVLSEGNLPYGYFQRRECEPNHPWPTRCDRGFHSLVQRWQQIFPSLGDQFQVTGAATVAEAYQLRSLLQDRSDPKPGDLIFANSGTLDRYRLLWGLKRCRYLGQRYQYPVVPVAGQRQLSPRRLHQAQQPKIIVAGLSRYLEAILDATGTVLAGKSTCVIMADTALWVLLGILNSTLMRRYVAEVFGGQQLQGGYLTVGPPLLRQLPLPVIRDRYLPSPKAQAPQSAHAADRSAPPLPQTTQQLCQLLQRHTQIRQALQHQWDDSPTPQHNQPQSPPLLSPPDLAALPPTGPEPMSPCLDPVLAKIEAVEQAIDGLVYKLYGLNDQEIAWVKAA